MCAPSHHMVPARTHPTELVTSYRPRAAQLSDLPLSQQDDMPHLRFQALPARHRHSSAYHPTISTTGRVWHPDGTRPCETLHRCKRQPLQHLAAPPDIPTEIGRRDTKRIKWTPAISITNGVQYFTIRCQREHVDTIWRRATTHWRTG